VDPFGVTSDPALYVPRLGTEAALAALRRGFTAGKRISVLSGPPGLGKTMVLHVFARDLTSARARFLPYPALAPDELAQLALGAEEHADGEPALAALAQLAKRDPSRPLALLIDDAGALPTTTSRELRKLVDQLGGALRVIAAVADEARSSASIAALGDGIHHVRLKQPMLAREVGTYVQRRLELAGLPASSLHKQQIAWLAEESGGVPRVLNTLAARLLHTAFAIGSEVAPSERAAPGESGTRLGPPPAMSREPIAPRRAPVSAATRPDQRAHTSTEAPRAGFLAWLRALLPRFRRH
jgi:type II secretory pathway predicted ATPase ExeA